jgi:oligopeptide/dipeptide ABC transporter ATP-binding protein
LVEVADVALVVEGLSKTFYTRSGPLQRSRSANRAVRDVSFRLQKGRSLAIVGESGSGKTTVARMLVGLEAADAGRILLGDRELAARPTTAEKRGRAGRMQIVFQDPYGSLTPHMTIRQTLDEVQKVHFSRAAKERAARTHERLEAVGLGEREARALPRNLSGGQRQRAAIARALAAEPEILILDEAVSALDVSIQAQILNLLNDLRRDFGLSYIVISHDLAVVRQVTDDALVMYRGQVVERGSVETILGAPHHPYTQRLLASIPRPGMVLRRRTARVAAGSDQRGCLFRDRCPYAFDRCLEDPVLLQVAAHHESRCWLADAGRERLVALEGRSVSGA